ncbi:MAG: tRNA pseudouridine(38-40) synthase TruA [Chloroflexi bacterium]|nr:tRNA pseudouridine(38-40) synthase TruA [Chloroflexota bacterium]
MIVEYDGSNYFGFQLQASGATIQGEIEGALWKLTGERTRIVAASRTDTGVHAWGQVVSFRTSSSHSSLTFVNGLNYYLPKDIAVRAAYKVRDSFGVRHDALSREYAYYIWNSPVRSPIRADFSYHVRELLDVVAMNQACQALIGEHDFASFASDLKPGLKTVRKVFRAEVAKDGELVIFTMIASSFLPHQVRNTTGLLVRVGQGKAGIEEFHRVIEARKPGLAGPAAPPCGLCLVRVNYPHSFEEEKL